MSISEKIKNAKPEEISDILLAAQKRYKELFPDWELHILTLEKAVDKKEQIDRLIAVMEGMKER